MEIIVTYLILRKLERVKNLQNLRIRKYQKKTENVTEVS